MEFIDAIKQGSLTDIRRCKKADLHNHFVLGGSRRYLKEHAGRDIQPIIKPFHSMDEMHAWNAANIGDYFNSAEGRRMLIKAAFAQAREDGVSILEIGEDVWGLNEFFLRRHRRTSGCFRKGTQRDCSGDRTEAADRNVQAL